VDTVVVFMTAVAVQPFGQNYFWKSNISQGCVATCFQWGGNYNDHCITNLLLPQ